MEWVVSVETAGEADSTRATDLPALALALRHLRAVVERREHGYGATLLVNCDDPQEALSYGLRVLRDAEVRAGVPGRPLVCAEVTAASEVAGAPVPMPLGRAARSAAPDQREPLDAP